MLANKQNKNIQELFENVSSMVQKPNVPIVPPIIPINPISQQGGMQPPMQTFHPQNQEHEPSLNLVPEHQWAQKYPVISK